MNEARDHVCLAYGRTGLDLRIPRGATVLAGAEAPALRDPAAALRQGLAQPIGCPPLRALLRERLRQVPAGRAAQVALTISDITRPVPNRAILPVLLEELNAAGVADDQVTILIGTGLHRPSTAGEREELVGLDVLRRCAVVDHRADDPVTLTRLCADPPVSVNTRFLRADFRIVTGLIEPHFMAGFSGGRKGVCPALVDLATVQRFHGFAFLDHPASATGVLAGNPCHAEALRIARAVGVDFLVNVAVNRRRELAGVYCGDLEAAHAAGVAEVARWAGAALAGPADLVITSAGGYPLDQTFYQTVKGMVAALPACHDQTIVLIASHCGEGIGSPSYTALMRQWAGDWRGFLRHIAAAPEVRHDQWQIQMHAKVLQRIGVERLWLVSDGLPAEAQRGLMVTPVLGAGDAAQRCQRAVDEFVAARPGARVAVIPDGPYTMVREEGGREPQMNTDEHG